MWHMDLEIRNFYVMEYLSILPIEPYKHSHERYRSTLHYFKTVHEHRLASAMGEYLLKASFGEARHSSNRISRTYKPLANVNNRETAFEHALQFEPVQLSRDLEHLFRDYTWCGSYGGEKWADICKAARMYFQDCLHNGLPPSTFIDHSCDLAHNGRLCWDKGLIFTPMPHHLEANLQTFLTNKTYFDLDKWELWMHLPPTVLGLIKQARDLGLLTITQTIFVPETHKSMVDHEFHPAVWGVNVLGTLGFPECSKCGKETDNLVWNDEADSHICQECNNGYYEDDEYEEEYRQPLIECWFNSYKYHPQIVLRAPRVSQGESIRIRVL